MANKSLLLNINVINGEVQENPVPFYFYLNKVNPIGITIVRWFDFNQCSLATKVFTIEYEGNTFGTRQFKTMDDYWQWYYGGEVAETLGFLLNSDPMLLNGINATYTL